MISSLLSQKGCWISDINTSRFRDAFCDNRARTNSSVFAYFHLVQQYSITADETAFSDFAVTVYNRSCRNVTKFAHTSVVLNDSSSVDYAIVSYFSTRIDACVWHYDNTFAYLGLWGYARVWRNQRCKLTASRKDLKGYFNPLLRAVYLPDSEHEPIMVHGEAFERAFRELPGVIDFEADSDSSLEADAIVSKGVDYILTRLGVPTSTQHYEAHDCSCMKISHPQSAALIWNEYPRDARRGL
jgi:hypothetical protein